MKRSALLQLTIANSNGLVAHNPKQAAAKLPILTVTLAEAGGVVPVVARTRAVAPDAKPVCM